MEIKNFRKSNCKKWNKNFVEEIQVRVSITLEWNSNYNFMFNDVIIWGIYFMFNPMHSALLGIFFLAFYYISSNKIWMVIINWCVNMNFFNKTFLNALKHLRDWDISGQIYWKPEKSTNSLSTFLIFVNEFEDDYFKHNQHH